LGSVLEKDGNEWLEKYLEQSGELSGKLGSYLKEWAARNE